MKIHTIVYQVYCEDCHEYLTTVKPKPKNKRMHCTTCGRQSRVYGLPKIVQDWKDGKIGKF